MTTEPRKLSVIIVAWNVADFTERCIESVVQTTRDLNVEILLVDNGSTDGVAERIPSRYPQVSVLRNDQNIGFPAANNQALARAQGEYVLFLNPDTVVKTGTIAQCVSRLYEDAAVGAVGCRLELEDGSTQLEGARRTYRLRHLLAEVLYLHMLFPRNAWAGDHRMSWWNHRGAREVEALSGAFLMTRTGLARGLGGLPEDLFMYHEDLAYCLRMRRAGWRIWYEGEVSTVHYWRRSSERSPLALDLLVSECRVLLVREAQGRVFGSVARVVWGVGCMVRLVVALSGFVAPAAWRERFPRVFDVRRHALQIVWAFLPWLLAARIPRAPQPVGQVAADPAF